MPEAFFVPVGAGRYEPTPHVVGPWDPGHMHGGPGAALLLHEAQARAGDHIPVDALPARVAVDFLGPVPVAPVSVDVSVVRSGRRVALVSAALSAGGRPALLARIWFARRAAVAVPPEAETPAEQAPAALPLEVLDPPGWNQGYLQAVEWGVAGGFGNPGPATAWARSRYPLVVDRELEPMEHLLLVADSGSGLSARVDPTRLLFVNTDLTVHVVRPPTENLVWLRSVTRMGLVGTGLATTQLGDRAGELGTAAQSLFVAPPSAGGS